MGFEFLLPAKIIFGRGSLARIREEVARLGGTGVLLVTSLEMLREQALVSAAELLREGGMECRVFAGVDPEARMENACDCVALARAKECNLVVGFGRGPVLDVAKKAAAEVGACSIMVPTTAGSGGEVTHEVVLRTNGEARSFRDAALTPDVALVDPDLTDGTPPRATVIEGIDALAHAIESEQSAPGNPMVTALAAKARQLIWENLRAAADDVPEARTNLSLGSLFAGLAAGNSTTTLSHALAYPLTAQGIPHGEAVCMMLPYALEFNGAGADMSDGLRALMASAGISFRFTGDVQELARAVLRDTRRLEHNPRPVTGDDVVAIYQRARADYGT